MWNPSGPLGASGSCPTLMMNGPMQQIKPETRVRSRSLEHSGITPSDKPPRPAEVIAENEEGFEWTV